MNRVTYIIGAGFSAPLGLPLMHNFLIKSKDLYFQSPDKYPHFKKVFTTIDKMSVIKNYYATDLFNIEEILSIMEMRDKLFGKGIKKEFAQYIIDVIKGNTPSFGITTGNYGNWYDHILGNTETHKAYGYFISNILGVKYYRENDPFSIVNGPRHYVDHLTDRESLYSIITLNYDLVFENILNGIVTVHKPVGKIEFVKDRYSENWENPHLAKLHGCVEGGTIIPPTWAKGINQKIKNIWQNAFNILQNSNEIRIIGYSLPQSDAYIKYLLKAAVVDTNHLKYIDVISLDKNNEVKKRYDELLPFNYYRFVNSDVTAYMKMLLEEQKRKLEKGGDVIYKMDRLEFVHHEFMKNH